MAEYTNPNIIGGDASLDYHPDNQPKLWTQEELDTAISQTKMVSGQGAMEETKEGCKRESNKGRGRFDLLPYEAIEALAMWYEAGAEKYAERNWEEGISVKDCINRMYRHAAKAASGWTDENHLAAVMWNAAAAITMMQRRPDCNDHDWLSLEESIRRREGNKKCSEPK